MSYRRRPRTRKAKKATSKETRCTSPRCRNEKALVYSKYKTKSGKVKVYKAVLSCCWKCKSRLLKQRREHTYVLNMIRLGARRRGLDFSLTLDQFKEFCDKTGYLEKRGNSPDSYTIDRINMQEGYHIWNIRIMSHADNSAQGVDNRPRKRHYEAPDEIECGQELSSRPDDPF